METKLHKFGTLFLEGKPYQTSDIVTPTELFNRSVVIGNTVPGFEIEWVEYQGLYVSRMPLLVSVAYKDLGWMSGRHGVHVDIDGRNYEMRFPVASCSNEPSQDDLWFRAVQADAGDIWEQQEMYCWGEQEAKEDPFQTRNAALFSLGQAHDHPHDLSIEKSQFPNWDKMCDQGHRAPNIGWRPMLDCVSLDPEELEPGTLLKVFFGSHTAAYGRLGDISEYDIVLEDLQRISQLDPSAQFINRRTVIIDRKSIKYLRLGRRM